MGLPINIFIILIYALAAVVIIHSYKFRGIFKTLLLLLGVFIVGGGIENINVIFKGYDYPREGLTIFFYHCPLWVVLGWYGILYCASFASHILIGRGKGSIICKQCHKSYGSFDLKELPLGHGKTPYDIEIPVEKGFLKRLLKPPMPIVKSGLDGVRYLCPQGHELISIITWIS